MKLTVNSSAGYQFTDVYVKASLFEYLANYEDLAIGEISANDFVDRVEALRPIFTVDDILAYADENGVTLDQALIAVENEFESM